MPEMKHYLIPIHNYVCLAAAKCSVDTYKYSSSTIGFVLAITRNVLSVSTVMASELASQLKNDYRLFVGM